MEIVKLTSKGQLVIPQEIREELKLHEGDRILLFRENGTMVLRPLKLVSKEVEEEMIEMKLAAQGWKEIEEGKYKEYKNVDEFLESLWKW